MASKIAQKLMKEVPAGFRLLSEGKANVLYHIKDDKQKDVEMTSDQKGKKISKWESNAEKKVKVKTEWESKDEKGENRDTVFYNPVQEFNRDLSILWITEYGTQLQKQRETQEAGWSGIKILEALSATGLRSVRYMKEIGVDIQKIVSNDWDPEAAKLIERNFEFNDIPKEKTEVKAMDALDLMYEKRKEKDYYDVIDLDPYGTAVPFLDSSIQALEDGGFLWVTFTDTAVLWSSKPHAWYYRYGAVTTHKKNCHEFALRLVLHTIATTANRYQKQIIPMLSLTADFYLRLFIKVVRKPILCHDSILNTSYVFQWNGWQNFHLHSVGKSLQKKKHPNKREKVKENEDEEEKNGEEDVPESQKQSKRDHAHNTKFAINTFTFPPKWEIWDSSFMIGGPIWSSEIHDQEFVDSLLDRISSWKHLGTYKRIKETLSAVQQEMSIGNFPLSLEYDRVISEIKSESISRKQIFSAFKSLGYDLVQTYYKPGLYKTNAPHSVVYDIFKRWKMKKIEGTKKSLTDKWAGIALKILEKPPTVNPDFEFKHDEIHKHLKKNKVKYNENPPNWGPGTRATSIKNRERKASDKQQEELNDS